MKQTAVEWLNEQMNNIKGSSINMNGRVEFIEKELNNLFEQAKEMEKKQIINAYFWGRFESDNIVMGHSFYAKQYYNETFKSE
jgi:hypothetical protein